MLPTGKNVSLESSLNWIQESFHKVKSEPGTAFETIPSRNSWPWLSFVEMWGSDISLFLHSRQKLRETCVFVYSLFRVRNRIIRAVKISCRKNTLKCAGHLISSYPEAYVTYINHVPFVLKRKFDFIHPRPVHQTVGRNTHCRNYFLYYSL